MEAGPALSRPAAALPRPEASVLALQRGLVEAALRPDPAPLDRDPAPFAASLGLSQADQAAFQRFGSRLLFYRNMVRSDLVAPVEATFLLTGALLRQAGAWEACLSGFLASRAVDSVFYRDLSPTFLGWMAATGWGQDRWPSLLQLAHFELLTVLVAHHPGGAPAEPTHPDPAPGDRLVLEAPTQLVSYAYRVHEVTLEEPVPDEGATHLLACRDAQGRARWTELTPATAALLLGAQRVPIGQAMADLGLEDPNEAMDLLAEFQAKGAIRGFRA